MATDRLFARPLEYTDVGLPGDLPVQLYTQGRIDQVTLGCSCVKSDVRLHKNGRIETLSMKYWYRLPNNQDVATSLFEIKTGPMGIVQEFTVAGRPLDLNNSSAVEAALQAIRHIHDSLKESRFPNIALSFHENELARHIGKSIKIVGQKLSGEPDFTFSSLFNYQSTVIDPQPMALPADPDMFKALLGLSANPLRRDMDLLAARQRMVNAYEPTSLVTYENKLLATEGKSGNLRVQMVTQKQGEDPAHVANAYRNLLRIETSGGSRSSLRNLVLMGQNLNDSGHIKQAQAFGVANGMISAFARHAAPVPMMQLVNYDMRAAISDPRLVAEIQGIENPFLRISLAGNRYTKLYGPYGGDLGNTTLLMHGGVSILHDFALKPAPDGEKTSGAVASIQDWLPGMDAICLTHRHIDHAGGIPYENFKDKLVLATPQVIEHVRDTMRSVHGSRAKLLMPRFMPLTENGFHTISKDDGKSGITILYSPNATPHSSYCTPFYYAAFDTNAAGKKFIKGVYANIGDTRDEEDVAEEWFRHGWQVSLKKAHPDLDVGDIPMVPTFAEWDSTSVRYHGSTPGKAEVLDNLIMAVGWFDGYTILNAHLASSDNQFDMMVKTAATHGRDFTTFGKNMETTQRIQNIFGYTELNEPWAQGHQNQIHMDSIHAARLQKRLEALSLQAPSDGDIEEFTADMDFLFAHAYTKAGKVRSSFRKDLEETGDSDMIAAFSHHRQWKSAEKKEDDIEADIHRLHLFRKWSMARGKHSLTEYLTADLTRALHASLANYTNNYWRFKQRKAYATEYDIQDIRDLGALSITRATMTSANMFSENADRMFIALTGSQGNEVEVEAQLPKFLEKRALLNLDPRYRHTARPLDMEKTVLFITQPAIVGNEKVRERLVHKAARDYGMIVVNATHDGFEIYNTHKLPADTLRLIRNDLIARNTIYQEMPVDHRVVVAGPLPLGYRGHGRRQDMKRWMVRTRAEVNAPQHINDPEAGKEIEILSKSLRQGNIPLVEDFEVASIDRFARMPADKVKVLGSIPAGITVLRIEYPHQKPYRPVVHRQRIIVLEPEKKASLFQPLMAGCTSRAAITRDFGPVTAMDTQDVKKTNVSKFRPGTRPAPGDLMKFFGIETWPSRPAVRPVPAPGSASPRLQTIELV